MDKKVRAAERFRLLVEELMLELRSQEAVGEALGVSQTYVSKILAGGRSAGLKTVFSAMERLGLSERYFFGEASPGTYREFLVAPPSDQEPPPDHPMPPAAKTAASTTKTDPRYQRLETVIEYWRLREPGKWSANAIAAVRSVALEADEDPTAKDWEGRLDAFEATIRRIAQGQQPGVEVNPDEELSPPAGRRKR